MLSVAGSLPPLHIPRRGWLALSDKQILSGIGPFVESWHASGNCKEEWKPCSRLGIFDGENYIAQLIALPNGHVLARSNSRLAVIHSSQLETNGQLQERQTVSPRLTSRVDKEKEKEEKIEEQILHVELLEQGADEGCFRLLVWTSFHVRLLELTMGNRLQCTANTSIATWDAVVDRVSIELVETDVFSCAAESVNDSATFLCEISPGRKFKTVQRRRWKNKHVTPIPVFDDSSFTWRLNDEELVYHRRDTTKWNQHRLTNTFALIQSGCVNLYTLEDKDLTITWSDRAPFVVHSIGAVTMHTDCCYSFFLGGECGEVCRLRVPFNRELRPMDRVRLSDHGPRQLRQMRALGIQPDGTTVAVHEDRIVVLPRKKDQPHRSYAGNSHNMHIAFQKTVPLAPGCYDRTDMPDHPVSIVSSSESQSITMFGGSRNKECRFSKVDGAPLQAVMGVRWVVGRLFLAVVKRIGVNEPNLVQLTNRSRSVCVIAEPDAVWRSYPLNAACCVLTDWGEHERVVVMLRGRGQLCQLRLAEKRDEWTTREARPLMRRVVRERSEGERRRDGGPRLVTETLPLDRQSDVVDIAPDNARRSRLCVLEKHGRFRKILLAHDQKTNEYMLGDWSGDSDVTRQLPLDWAYSLFDGHRYAAGMKQGAFVIVQCDSGATLARILPADNWLPRELAQYNDSPQSTASPPWAAVRLRGDDCRTPATLGLHCRDGVHVARYEMDVPSLLVHNYPSLRPAARPRAREYCEMAVVNVGRAQVVVCMDEAAEWDDSSEEDLRRVDLAMYVDDGKGSVHHSNTRARSYDSAHCFVLGCGDVASSSAVIDVLAEYYAHLDWYHLEVDETGRGSIHTLTSFNLVDMKQAIAASAYGRKKDLLDVFESHSATLSVMCCRTLGAGSKRAVPGAHRKRTLRFVVLIDASCKKEQEERRKWWDLPAEERQEKQKQPRIEKRFVGVFDVHYQTLRDSTGWKLCSDELLFRFCYESTSKDMWNPIVISLVGDEHMNVWSELEGGPTRTFRIGEGGEEATQGEKHYYAVNVTNTHSAVYLVEAYTSLSPVNGKGRGELVCISGEDRHRNRGLIDCGWQTGGAFSSLGVARLADVNGKACLTRVVLLRERPLSKLCSVLWVVSQQDFRRPISVHYLVLRWRDGVPKAVGQFSHAFDVDCALDNDDHSRICHLTPFTDSASTLDGFVFVQSEGQAQTVYLCQCHTEIVQQVERNAPKQAERALLKRKTA